MWLWLLGALTLGALLKSPRRTYATLKAAYVPGSFKGQSWASYAAKKHGQAFVEKSAKISYKHGLQLGELLAMFHHESAFSASVVNFLGCVGLIQFCPDYIDKKGRKRQRGASFVGKTPAQLKAMSAVEQLDMVDLYISRWKKSKMPRPGHEAEDINMLIFHPAHMGRPDKYSAEDNKYLAGYYRSFKAGLKPGRVG